MSGTKQPAEKGQLIFVCGGDKELFERAAPLLDVMGKAKFYLGPVRPAALCQALLRCLLSKALCPLALCTSAGHDGWCQVRCWIFWAMLVPSPGLHILCCLPVVMPCAQLLPYLQHHLSAWLHRASSCHPGCQCAASWLSDHCSVCAFPATVRKARPACNPP